VTSVLVTGAAGLVGQNLIPRLAGCAVTGIDKHRANTATLRRLHPAITTIEADLAHDDGWQDAAWAADVVVIAHAQIGGLRGAEFRANNVTATARLLEVLTARPNPPYVVHLSSSVVHSAAGDDYVTTKREQEALVVASGLPAAILRPTLMFGWFDRKHLGWLARFMRRVPVFPVPGHGNYVRQPLYAGDFAAIIAACIARRPQGAWNISGQEIVSYLALIQALRRANRLRTPIIRIPYALFASLLRLAALVSANPPFTVKQLEALVIPETFEVIDWPGIFGVPATPLARALEETFNHPVYAAVELEF